MDVYHGHHLSLARLELHLLTKTNYSQNDNGDDGIVKDGVIGLSSNAAQSSLLVLYKCVVVTVYGDTPPSACILMFCLSREPPRTLLGGEGLCVSPSQ